MGESRSGRRVWPAGFDAQKYKAMGNESKLDSTDMMVYLSMETGIGLAEILELPMTVFNIMVNAVNKIYEERNRLQEEAIKNG